MTQLIQFLICLSSSGFYKHQRIKNWSRFNKLQHLVLLLTVISCNSIHEKKKWKYIPLSKAVVQINFLNDPNASYFVSESDDMYIPSWNNSNILELKQKGEYFLPIEIEMPGKVQILFDEQTFNIFLFPEDTSIINIEFNEEGFNVSFDGLTKNINRYYMEKKLNFDYLDFRDTYEIKLISNTKFNKVLEKADSFTNRELDFLDEYKSSTKLSRLFKNFEKSEILYAGLLYKIQGSERYIRTRERSFPSNYYNFLENVDPNNKKAIYSETYYEFFDEYLKWKYPVEEERSIPWRAWYKNNFSITIINAEKELTGRSLEIFKKIKFSQVIPYYSDTTSLDSIARKYQITKYERLFRIMGTKPSSEKLMPGDTIPDIYVTDDQNTLISVREFKNHYLILRFYDMNSNNSITQNFEIIDEFIKYERDDRIKLINICLGCEYNQWAESNLNTRLQGINLIAEFGWEDKLKKWFNIKGMPHFAIVNTGNVLYHNVGASAEPINHIDMLLKKSTELP